MTIVTRQFRENRLAKLVLAPSGLTKAAAASAAQANLETIHDQCMTEVDHDFALLKRCAADPRVGDDVKIQRAIYAHANTIAGLAGSCGLGEMGEAAFSLCELVDRQITSGAWNAQSVTVHVDAMSLLRVGDSELTAEGRRAMIAGLRDVALHAPASRPPASGQD